MADADLKTVEQLCRLQLAARRLGCQMRVHDASDSLRTLITLVGLADILLADDAPLVTYRRRSEQSERRDQFLARERSTRADPHDSSGVAPPPGGS